ncbi:MAG: response regulator [Chloroherpetonaceae bacterium]|nr:response regulator [Chloroherpetonaceae bacterium]
MYLRSLLIIDDDPNVHNLYAITLHDFHLKIHSCFNGFEGYQELRSNSYDLALMDIEMPEMTGLQVLERLTGEGVSFPPVIVISAAEGNHLISDCMNRGASDYLKKPVRTSFLKSVVRDILDTVDITKQSLPRAMYEMARRKSTADLIISTDLGIGNIKYKFGKLIEASFLGKTGINAVDLLKEIQKLKIDVEHR